MNNVHQELNNAKEELKKSKALYSSLQQRFNGINSVVESASAKASLSESQRLKDLAELYKGKCEDAENRVGK